MSFTGNLMFSNSDLFDACPSLQSGSWSALMQFAVAETSSDDAGVHQSVWGNTSTAPHVNSSNTLRDRVHSDSTQTDVQHLHNSSGHGLLEKPVTQRSQMAGNIFQSSGSGIDGQNNSCSIPKTEGIEDRLSIWNAASNPNLADLKEQNNNFTQNLQMHRESYGFRTAGAGNVSRDVQGNIQQQRDINSMEKATPQLNVSTLPDGKETQSGHVGVRPSIPRKFQYHPMGNIDVTDEPGREFFSLGGQRLLVSQLWTYALIRYGHVSQNELNCTNKAFKGMVSENSPSSSDNQVKSASSRLDLLHKVEQSQEHSVEANVSRIPEAITSAEYVGQFQNSQSSGSQGFCLQLAPPSPDNVQFLNQPSKPQPDIFRPHPLSSKNVEGAFQGRRRQINYPPKMEETLDLLHKVEQSQEHSVEANVSRIPEAITSAEYVGQFQNSQSSGSQGFCLQLAPPSPDNVQFLNQPSKPQPDIFRPHPLSSKNVEGSFSRQEKTNQLSSQNGGDVSLSGRKMVNTHELQGQDMAAKQTSTLSKTVQSNHQTFGRYLPSNNFPKDNMRHDEHMGGSGESDKPKMTAKRVKDSDVHIQKVASEGEQQSPSRSDGLNQKDSTNLMLHFGQAVAQSFSNKNHSASP
ncbi:hypothetical protein Bca52824_021589 [Brassica carinata]|uniref:Uncharacterized protein n=1 Tax=Brassica carinata TaxID=52824 RepID=A0A8X8ATD0_BRACI|nr:hypothetical protein Bca52824_021589 [Brassica carinata]